MHSLFNNVIYCGLSLEAVAGINPHVAPPCPICAGKREDKTEGRETSYTEQGMRGCEAHAMTRFLASCDGEGAMVICALQECVCVCMCSCSHLSQD